MRIILLALMLASGLCYADEQYLVYNDKGSVIVQEQGDTLYVHKQDGTTDVLFKQDESVSHDDAGDQGD